MNSKTKFFLIILTLSIAAISVGQVHYFFVPLFLFCILIVIWLYLYSSIFSTKVKINEVDKIELDIENNLKIQEQNIAFKCFDSEKFDSLLQSVSNEKKQEEYFRKIFSLLSSEINIYQGLLFVKTNISKINHKSENADFAFAYQYALFSEEIPHSFTTGEGLHGQAALNKKISILDEISNRLILSGLGKTKPSQIAIIPLTDNDENVWGIMELAFLEKLSDYQKEVIEYLKLHLHNHANPLKISANS